MINDDVSEKTIKALNPSVDDLKKEIKRISKISSDKTKLLNDANLEIREKQKLIFTLESNSGKFEREKLERVAQSMRDNIDSTAREIERARVVILEGEAKIKAFTGVLTELGFNDEFEDYED